MANTFQIWKYARTFMSKYITFTVHNFHQFEKAEWNKLIRAEIKVRKYVLANNKGNAPMLTDNCCIIRLLLKKFILWSKVIPYMWTGVSRSSIACLCSRRLRIRSCWFSWDCVLPLVLDIVFVFMAWRLSSDYSGVSRSSLLVFAHIVSEDEVALRLFSWCLRSCSLDSLVFCITIKSCWGFSRYF